jgi:hypothetical protein
MPGMIDARCKTGSQLQFADNIRHVELTPRDQDGVLVAKRTFRCSEIALALEGENGWVLPEGADGVEVFGNVVFVPAGAGEQVKSKPGHDGWALGTEAAFLGTEQRPLPGSGNIEAHDYQDDAYPRPGETVSEGSQYVGMSVDQLPRPDVIDDRPLLNTAHSVPEGFAAKVMDTVRNRGGDYGTPADNHQLTADLLTSYFSRRFNRPVRFTAEDVCVFNIVQKMSRLAYASKDDSYLDICGYAENVAMLRPEQRKR